MNMNWQHYWKTILAFLSLLATNIATRLVTMGEPLPESAGDWLTFIVTTVGGTWLVFQKSNAPKIPGD
jgi:hypothetical protein